MQLGNMECLLPHCWWEWDALCTILYFLLWRSFGTIRTNNATDDRLVLPSSKCNWGIWNVYCHTAGESEMHFAPYSTFCCGGVLEPSVLIMRPMTDLCCHVSKIVWLLSVPAIASRMRSCPPINKQRSTWGLYKWEGHTTPLLVEDVPGLSDPSDPTMLLRLVEMGRSYNTSSCWGCSRSVWSLWSHYVTDNNCDPPQQASRIPANS